jgi:hypothetical protein
MSSTVDLMNSELASGIGSGVSGVCVDGRVENSGTENVKMEFCFGMTTCIIRCVSIREPTTVKDEENDQRFSLLSRVIIRNVFSVSWMTIPDSPIRDGHLLCLTAYNQEMALALSHCR